MSSLAVDGDPVGLITRGPGLRLAVFAIEGWPSALPLTSAGGLLRMAAAPPLPGARAAALAPISLPGRVIPCRDIERRLGLPPRDGELPSEGPGDRNPRGRGLPGNARALLEARMGPASRGGRIPGQQRELEGPPGPS